MRSRLILPLLAALALAACETPSQETASGEGAGVADGASLDTVETFDTMETIDLSSEDTELVMVDPDAPLPGSQEDLVQNVGDRVFFELDSAVLSPQARATLERQAEWLRLFPEVRIAIEGHCDERGTREYNLALGERRANAAREYLVGLGIDPSRLRTLSYGKERPYALSHDEEAWSLNRRAVSVIE